MLYDDDIETIAKVAREIAIAEIQNALAALAPAAVAPAEIEAEPPVVEKKGRK